MDTNKTPLWLISFSFHYYDEYTYRKLGFGNRIVEINGFPTPDVLEQLTVDFIHEFALGRISKHEIAVTNIIKLGQ